MMVFTIIKHCCHLPRLITYKTAHLFSIHQSTHLYWEPASCPASGCSRWDRDVEDVARYWHWTSGKVWHTCTKRWEWDHISCRAMPWCVRNGVRRGSVKWKTSQVWESSSLDFQDASRSQLPCHILIMAMIRVNSWKMSRELLRMVNTALLSTAWWPVVLNCITLYYYWTHRSSEEMPGLLTSYTM